MDVRALFLGLLALAAAGLVIGAPKLVLRWVQGLTHEAVFRAELVLSAVVFALLALALGVGTSASFTAAAKTEALELTIGGSDKPPVWPLPTQVRIGGRSLPDAQCLKPRLVFSDHRKQDIKATFSVLGASASPGAVADAGSVPSERFAGGEVERAAPSGLRILLSGDAGDLGQVRCERGPSIAVGNHLTLDYSPQAGDPSPTFPLKGVMKIGGTAADPIPSDLARPSFLLLSGVLSTEATAWPAKTGRARSETPLQFGDVLTFTDGGRNAPAQVPAVGLVRPEGDAMSVVAHATAARAQIARKGADKDISIAYAPTLWTRVQAMSEWSILILLGGLAVAMVSAARRYLDVERIKSARD